MTFSIVGRCRRSGMLGVAITTSSICVGARCPYIRAGVGAVATQNLTDPTLGPAVLDQLAAGLDAPDALRAALNNRAHLEHRQVTVVDHRGNTACHSGSQMLGINGAASGDDCVAAGNLLASESVVAAIVQEFVRDMVKTTSANGCSKPSKRGWRPAANKGKFTRRPCWWRTSTLFLWWICGLTGAMPIPWVLCATCGMPIVRKLTHI